jgi:hypothetical protein
MSSHPVGTKRETRLSDHDGVQIAGALDSRRAVDLRRGHGVQTSIVF